MLSLPQLKDEIIENEGDTIQIGTYTRQGKVGFLIEGGRFTMTYSKIVPYIDYGIRFKLLRGYEDYKGINPPTENTDTVFIDNSARFDNYYFSAHFNANNAIRVSNRGFIQNTLGLNIDYRVIQSRNGTIQYSENTVVSSEVFLVQLHYKIGYGFRMDKKHYLIFTLETPILTAYPWDDGKPTIAMFNSRYQPISLSVRLLFLSNSTRPDCNKPIPLNMDKKHKKAKMF